MINLIKIEALKKHELKLTFSDNSWGILDFSYVLDAQTVLTNPLKEKKYFDSCFIEFGALCWKNGLEFSAESLYHKLKNQDKLHISQDVA